MDVRDLYIDLVGKTVRDAIYGDPAIDPKRDPHVKSRDDWQEGKIWPAVAHTMIGEYRLDNVKKLAERALKENIPGHFIETGVWKGGCCVFMRAILAAYGVTDRCVYVADSFEGLPPPNKEAFPQDKDSTLHEYKAQLGISLERVKATFSMYDLLDKQVVFVKGFFSDTLPVLDAGPFALMRLDGDMYESTIVALENLYPKLSPGGFVIIDDYKIPACAQAVTDFRNKNAITAPIQKIDYSGVWWRKPF